MGRNTYRGFTTGHWRHTEVETVQEAVKGIIATAVSMALTVVILGAMFGWLFYATR